MQTIAFRALLVLTLAACAVEIEEGQPLQQSLATGTSDDKGFDEREAPLTYGDYCVGYKNINRGGESFTFWWPYDYNDLHRAPNFGDTMSSIECFGVTLRVYRDSQWGGPYVDVTSYIANLGWMDNAVSSIKWEDSVGTGYCSFFRDKWYGGGPPLVVPYGVDWNDLHRALPSSWGDSISSMDCTGVSFVNLCNDDQWGGSAASHCTTFYGDDVDLHNNGYGDNISSVCWYP